MCRKHITLYDAGQAMRPVNATPRSHAQTESYLLRSGRVDAAIRELLEFPLLEALFGRRARRFGLGMEVPSGPLAFKSRYAPMPLSELEQAALIVAATGVSGWHFGIPHTPSRPNELSH
jgi:hypothetical protein